MKRFKEKESCKLIKEKFWFFPLFESVTHKFIYSSNRSPGVNNLKRLSLYLNQQLILVSMAWSILEYYHSPVGEMPFHWKVTPLPGYPDITSTHLYSWVKIVRLYESLVYCPEHNTMTHPGLKPNILTKSKAH